jgi:hypothetical protein
MRQIPARFLQDSDKDNGGFDWNTISRLRRPKNGLRRDFDVKQTVKAASGVIGGKDPFFLTLSRGEAIRHLKTPIKSCDLNHAGKRPVPFRLSQEKRGMNTAA